MNASSWRPEAPSSSGQTRRAFSSSQPRFLTVRRARAELPAAVFSSTSLPSFSFAFTLKEAEAPPASHRACWCCQPGTGACRHFLNERITFPLVETLFSLEVKGPVRVSLLESLAKKVGELEGTQKGAQVPSCPHSVWPGLVAAVALAELGSRVV